MTEFYHRLAAQRSGIAAIQLDEIAHHGRKNHSKTEKGHDLSDCTNITH